MGFTSLGHVYTATGDYHNALASHKQCVELIRNHLNDRLAEAREIGNVGAVYLAMGDFDKSQECHMEHLGLAQALNNKTEEELLAEMRRLAVVAQNNLVNTVRLR